MNRLFAMNSVPTISSDLYPELSRYYQAIGDEFVQTGDFFDIIPLVEMMAEARDAHILEEGDPDAG